MRNFVHFPRDFMAARLRMQCYTVLHRQCCQHGMLHSTESCLRIRTSGLEDFSAPGSALADGSISDLQ